MSALKRYDVLIAGATFEGLGIASAAGNRAVLIERTGGVGVEFTATYRQAVIDRTLAVSPRAEALRQEADGRNIISAEGGIHWPAFVPILHQVIQKEQLEVRFLTRIIEVAADPSGDYRVTWIDAAGLSTVLAGRIVDTTNFCETAPQAAAGYLGKRRLNAVIHNSSAPEQQPPDCDGYPVHGGRFATEWITSAALEAEDDWASARERLLAHWAKRPEALRPWQLATIADGFDVEVEAGTGIDIADRWEWRPTARYRDPVAAFEAGLQSAMGVRTA
ncbi:hypothetical protein PAESOLCIP111_05590 [Paenibacillus solanacearum]|uniref:Uncharacterized protein n=1 Tax=Paenibacillus solanacearum TaxID=2048548 RepID=A0A916K6F6_9BACL|nr:FAD-dependent oxidoreductase [Paenibacillus solanacearum]CAG7648394.1 hypothetical protein PAESOLCIP111_05590 [Paenibacillus solanacearum]